METGKVEYAPDYKSKSQVKRIAAQKSQPLKEFLAEQMRDPEFAEAYAKADVKVEHARLKDAVVDAAKKWRESRLSQSGLYRTYSELMDAVDSLLWFEREHKIGIDHG